MGLPVSFTPEAEADLEAIVRHIAEDDPDRAESFGYELVDAALSLQILPRRGKVTLEFSEPSIREIQHEPYRIIYRILPSGQGVDILRFWHGARGFPQLK
ncbi:type II toxin-antitoxin system RelE/ParE family toxin [Puniceicoccus vermicola]|uniref:Type II toxin-antitoxin system RelE/ParE family toxin n=1 Tax=Puniceicoccus vermicola TaxID=388746 RepID=A0A7X1AWH5_9BACT|nr:type II toxin-antitoxin system RelE/ParE family toxin [Puniceicoccus vermicola]MBC2601184.1 type II toxin-antitoxin system RelE/ParE family toxin [Puniceicoccus vermicola]